MKMGHENRLPRQAVHGCAGLLSMRWPESAGSVGYARRSAMRLAAAFTLIEMVISGALMTIILASAYLCLSSGLDSQRMVESRADALQSARVAMAIMSADLRGACLISKDYDFIGMKRMIGDVEADNLDFATHHYTPRRPQEGDYCVVSYFLQKDSTSGNYILCRRRLPFFFPNPLSGGIREEITGSLRGLRFEYYDGYEWYDSWGEPEGHRNESNSSRLDDDNMAGLPEAVRITLLMDSETSRKPVESMASQSTPPPPLVFKTLVRLNLSKGSLSLARSGIGTNTTSGVPGK